MAQSTDRFEIGETLVESYDGGPVVSRVHDIDLEDVHTLRVSRGELLATVAERLPDDYAGVWVYCNGRTLAVCDHEGAIEGADERHIDSVDDTLHRTDVLEAGDETTKALYTREHLVEALNSLDDERVLVHTADQYPLFVEGTDEAVAVAPRVKP